MKPKSSHKIFETNSSFLREIAHYGEGLIAIFRKAFANINKIFIFAGGLGTSLSFYGA